MSDLPEHDDFVERLRALSAEPIFKRLMKKGVVDLKALAESDIDTLIRQPDKAAFYFLMAAANLSRTKLKAATKQPGAQIAPKALRDAFALKRHLPTKVTFESIVAAAAALRVSDLDRKGGGDVERVLRERLISESIPILMSPPIRGVPGILTRAKRKPDGVYPDPATGRPPRIYLEIKRINRVSDDIQKRLYEIAEVSLEMKALYGTLSLSGLNLASTNGVLGSGAIRSQFRRQIVQSRPLVVALLICSRVEAEPYREGAQAFVDRVFFQEEIEECITFLKEACAQADIDPQ